MLQVLCIFICSASMSELIIQNFEKELSFRRLQDLNLSTYSAFFCAVVANMLPSDDIFGPWSVATAVVLGALLLFKVFFSSTHKNLPPGPRGLPLIGGLHLLGKHPYEELTKLAETYGPVMSFRFGQKQAVIASSPAAATEFLKTQSLNFSSRPRSSFGDLVLTADLGMGPVTPVTSHLKKILHMQLSTTKQLQLSENVRREEITHALRMMPRDGTTVISMRTYFEVVVTNILSRLVFKKRMMEVKVEGTKQQEFGEVRRFRELAEEIHECVVHKSLGDVIPMFKWIDIQGFKRRLQNLRKKMDAFMLKIVSEHILQRKNGTVVEKDMVDVLLDQAEDKLLNFTITTQNVTDVLWDAFAAGTTTTIEAVEWTMSECIRNPHVMKSIQAELDAIVGKSRRVEEADIPNLKYLQATVKEALRLHLLPLLLPHENPTACTAFGYDIPAGTTIMINARAIARDPNIWEDPLEFMPERFLDGMPHANTNIKGYHFELLPFGSGRRACPGMELACVMVQIQIATLLQFYDWGLPNGLQPKDLDMSEAKGLTPFRAQPLNVIPKARLSSLLL